MPISIEDDKILINDVELDVVKTVGTIDAVISTTTETVEEEIQEEQVLAKESLTNKIYGVGNNFHNQIGGNLSSSNLATPKYSSWFIDNRIIVSQIACGQNHTMFLTDDGNIYGFGQNSNYQLGYSNSTANQSTPRHLSWFREGGNNITITQIACGAYHTMFLTDDGNVYGVGRNSNYQLGYSNSTANQSTPRYLSWFREGGNNITISQIDCGYYHTMFLTDDGNVYGVGYNSHYQLGYSSTSSSQSTPRYLSWFREGGNNITITQIACGGFYTMFLTDDSNVYGVGYNSQYQLGYSSTSSSQSTPRYLSWFREGGNNITITQIACGGSHTMFMDQELLFTYIDTETVTNTVATTTINETIGNISYYPQWTYSSSNSHIYNYGNVGIGTIASDNDKLTVNGNINIIGNIAQNNLSMGYWYSNANNTKIYISGSLGIGSSNPLYSIESHGVIYSSAGGITGNASTYWTTVSDRRIKSNIEFASNEICFENVKNIDLYNFNYIGKDNKQYGFIAQEVAKYYPKAIKTESKKINEVVIDDLMSLDLSQINYTLFGAVKHVFNEINDIKKQIGMIKDDVLIIDEELLPE